MEDYRCPHCNFDFMGDLSEYVDAGDYGCPYCGKSFRAQIGYYERRDAMDE